jgi:chromosome segregation ATPase
MCEKAIVGHDLKQEMQLEVSKRLGQLESLKDEVQRRATEETEKEQQIAHLRAKCEEDKKAANRKDDSLTERMMEEQGRNQRAQLIINSLESALAEENYSEKLASEKHSKSIAELESWNGDIEQLHQDIRDMDDRVDASFFKIKYRIPLSAVSSIFCEGCQARSFHTSFKESVLLSNQSSTVRKHEKSGCSLM